MTDWTTHQRVLFWRIIVVILALALATNSAVLAMLVTRLLRIVSEAFEDLTR